ncbi:unnamed protein product [Callosobruchus maculatus]|uniref:C2H2-type domain-containing protein n=1 Tax=Callosobruchus maculatus TaxID=64391 RepID=A0A653D7L1_CALMS|nr:unnamed protein product [Callosobruchus maculatus]
MLKHPETADRYKFITCALCNDTFKDKRALDGHTLEKHPDSIGSISNKIYECTHCAFKTVKRVELTRHSLKHPEAADSYEFKTCIHCNAKYKYKIHLDEHTLRQHPEYFASVTYKIHACIQCSYKTVMKANLEVHMLKHPETADSFKFSTCVHCNVKFKRKISLDNHILRLHPEYIASVSSKIHECTLCAFKTVIKPDLTDHMLKHPETADNYEFITRVDRFRSNTCIHCNAIFKRKPSLHDHIVRTHPEYITSVSSKIHKCTHCTFKTIKKPELARHMLKHPETADRYNFSIPCVHCSATFNSKQTLIGHMLRRHPNFSGSISTKIYECLHCAYKVNKRDKFLKHILKHR